MSTTVTIPEITYNIDDLTSPGDPVPLYNQRSESEIAHAYVTIDPATGEVSTTTRFIGDAWDRRFNGVELIEVPRNVRGNALAEYLRGDGRELIETILTGYALDQMVDSGAEHDLMQQFAQLPTLAVWQANDWLGETATGDMIQPSETVDAAATRLAAEAMADTVYVIGIADYLRQRLISDAGDAIVSLWWERDDLIQTRKGEWLRLVPSWFKPVVGVLGYTMKQLNETYFLAAFGEPFPPEGVEWTPWRLLDKDGRDVRLMVLAVDFDAVFASIDVIERLCIALWTPGGRGAKDVIVSDGIRWTAHRIGDKRRRPVWDLEDLIETRDFEPMLLALAEGF